MLVVMTVSSRILLIFLLQPIPQDTRFNKEIEATPAMEPIRCMDFPRSLSYGRALPSLLTTKPVHHPCLQFNRNRGPPECPETMYRRPPNAIALRRQAGVLIRPPLPPGTSQDDVSTSGERCCTTAALMSRKRSKPPDNGSFCHHTFPKTTYRRPAVAVAPRRHYVMQMGKNIFYTC
ncbi:hypothetical protein B0H34DRAFT_676548 [Crassisporium funariophilum]|nr:hypothetical protein B0H34DRAFT_676548 [Crassisporium funariophilum]